MNEDDIFDQTGGAYLCLMHPGRFEDDCQYWIDRLSALGPSVPDDLVAGLIAGASWRERLIGLYLAASRAPHAFVQPALESLSSPRGISLVPACAFLAVLTRKGVYRMTPEFGRQFDRDAFAGELGWAVDKALHYAGLKEIDAAGKSPNRGQCFEDHAALYCRLLEAD